MKKRLHLSRFLLIFLSFAAATAAQAQEKVFDTFKDRRVINTQSVEVLQKRQFDLRISHRFGDIAGAQGGWTTFFGLEQAADVLIGGEYGITDQFTVGFARTKGGAQMRQLLNGFGKYRILHQTSDNSVPLSLTAVAMTSMSTMRANADTLALNHFPKFAHRFTHAIELHFARKFKAFSLQLSPIFVWRNIVPHGETNYLFSLALAARIQVAKHFCIILDASLPLESRRISGGRYSPPIGIGFEFETSGHVFQINLTNATGIAATDYIPYTHSNWTRGEFRLGFTISRLFKF